MISRIRLNSATGGVSSNVSLSIANSSIIQGVKSNKSTSSANTNNTLTMQGLKITLSSILCFVINSLLQNGIKGGKSDLGFSQLSVTNITSVKRSVSISDIDQVSDITISGKITVLGSIQLNIGSSEIHFLYSLGATANVTLITSGNSFLLSGIVGRISTSHTQTGSELLDILGVKNVSTVILLTSSDSVSKVISKKNSLSNINTNQNIHVLVIRDILVLVPDVVFDLITVVEIIDVIKGL